jgi:hypothetical protein
MKHLTRFIATIVVGLGAVMGLSGTARAYTEPIRPDGRGGKITTLHVSQAAADHVSSQGWRPAAVVGLVVLAILAAGLAVAARRAAGRRSAPSSVLPATS